MLMQFLKGKKKESDRELHKPIIRKLEKRQVHTLFIDNILSTDLVDMQLLNKSNKEICFLLCFSFYIFSEYAWVSPL